MPLARGAAQRLGQAVLQEDPVGQAGQRVVHRLMTQPALLRLGEGDVAHDRDQQPLVVDRGRTQRQLDRKGGAVAPPGHALEALAARARPRPLDPAVALQLREQLEQVAADQLVRPAAEHAQRRLVGGVDPTVGAHRENAVEAQLHDVAHQSIDLLQLHAVRDRELGLAAVDDPGQIRAVPHQEG